MTLKFNQLWASAASRIAWPESTVTGGWTSRIPRFQYDNNFLYEQHDKLWYKRQNGISEWSTNDDISKYDIVRASDGDYYVAKQDSGPWTLTGNGTNGTTTVQTSLGSVDPVTDASLTYWVKFDNIGDLNEIREFAFSTQSEVDTVIASGWRLLDGQNGSIDATGLALSGSEIDGARVREVGSIKLSYTTSATVPEKLALHTHQVDGFDTTLSIEHLPDHDHFFVDQPAAVSFPPTAPRPRTQSITWDSVLSYTTVKFGGENVGYTSGIARDTASRADAGFGQTTRYSFWNDQFYPNGKPASSHNHIGGFTFQNNNFHSHSFNISGEIEIDNTPKNIKLMLFKYVGF